MQRPTLKIYEEMFSATWHTLLSGWNTQFLAQQFRFIFLRSPEEEGESSTCAKVPLIGGIWHCAKFPTRSESRTPPLDM